MVRVLTLTLFIPEAASLKDKRQVLQGLIAKVRKLNVAVAELDYQDQWQRTQLGLAFISNQTAFLDSIQQQIIRAIESQYPVEITAIVSVEY